MRFPHISTLVLATVLASGCSTTPDTPVATSDPAEARGPSLDVNAFAIEHVVEVEVPPIEAFDAFTGDITAWWDHSFAETPASIVIEPWPGGRFLETFREGSTDGALHAVVTRAERGQLLAFTGPLGFAALGVHFDMVHMLRFEETESGTRLTMSVVGVGTSQPGWKEAVQSVWHHFLDDRFKPFVEGRLDAG